MKKILILLSLLVSLCSYAQRQMENLGRGLVAQKVSGGMYVNWRITGQEWYGTSYNLYRDGTKLNATPITGASNYTDPSGTTQSVYTVTSVKSGAESAPSKPALIITNNYLNITLRDLGVSGYYPNDATVADLDGDGEMEILIKRVYADWSIEAPHYSLFEAYKIDGTFLWAINLGPNIIDDVEMNIAAFDFDGDGRAEVFLRTSEGTIFGDGTSIDDTNKDGKINYRSGWSQYMFEGPEFLSLVDGETGKELDRIDYIPRTFGGMTYDYIWGSADGGHRCSKYFFGAPYLDGKKPSLFISRGIYTRIVMRTYDIIDKKFAFKWEFNTDNNPTYFAQGNHNYTIVDADGDGCDEIIYGSMTVDHDGKGLYSTGQGHGDAIHVGDLDPYHKGLEVWSCHEAIPGVSLRDAATGKILIREYTGKDCGRCMAANISNDFLGSALWGSGATFSATTRENVDISNPGTYNFNIYWDGDLLQETFDYNKFSEATGGGEGTVFKYKNGGASAIFTTSGALTNNWTKGTACIQVDLFGDWREEFIMRSADNKSLRIYTTSTSTDHRIYTLLHDMQYRQAICWQMGGYNQPPHTSYFLGELEGILLPPPPVMNNDRLVYSGSGLWAGTNWTKNGAPVSYTDGASLLFDANNGGTVTVANGVAPELLTVSNNKAAYTLQGGSLIGNMRLNKQGQGTFTLSSDLLYTGPTELWDGLTVIISDVQQSPVWMNRFAELNLKANLQKGLIQEYGSILRPGGNNEKATVTVSDSLWLKWGAQIDFDIYDADFTSDVLKVSGRLIFTKEVILNIIPHASSGKIQPGEYLLIDASAATIKGSVSELKIQGMQGIACSLAIRDNKIYLQVADTRIPAAVVWNGDKNNGEWNLASTQNFLKDGTDNLFITDDQVIMNDMAARKTVTITSDVSPASLLIDATSDYTISGSKAITGSSTFTKKGTGTATINNNNSFTGRIELLGGTVAVASLANSVTETGSLGALRTKASDFLIDGATLKGTGNALTSSSPMLIGVNGAIFNAGSGSITLEGALSGSGTLTKEGSGILSLKTGNTHPYTILNAGTLFLANNEALYSGPGSKIILNGGTIDCVSGNDYSTVNWDLEVPSGKTGNLNLDMRCDYNTNVTGSGTLNMFTPYIRSMLNGNWSTFEGTLNVTTDGDGGDLYVNNTYGGLPNANVNIASNVVVYNSKRTTVAFGSLTGTGILGGNDATREPCVHEWILGDKKASYKFDGIIYWGNLTKTGTSNVTLSNSGSTYPGGTNVKGGTLTLTNTSGSAVGTGKVAVQSEATLSLYNMTATTMGDIQVLKGGALVVTRSVTNGEIILENGSAMELGSTVLPYSSLTAHSITLANGASIALDIRSKSNHDKLQLTGTLSCASGAIVKIRVHESYVPVVTDTFQIVNTRLSGSIPTYELTPLPAGFTWDTSRLSVDGKLAIEATPDGLNAPEWSNKVALYPVPAVDVLHVSLPLSLQKVSVKVYDEQGTALFFHEDTDVSELHIPVTSLTNGIYMLVISTEEGESIHRFVKE